jgi:XTP/dITP diphosphohydrolase
MPTRIVLATRNAGKAAEFSRLLGAEFRVEPLPPGVGLPEETGSTFLQNATAKSEAVFDGLGGEVAVLADDSGLIAFALGDRPGVRSARYAGVDADDRTNMDRLLSDLEDAADRRARFVCALVLRLPRGGDPIFVPDGWTKTLAEVSGVEKDSVSHRARATQALRRRLREDVG